MRAYRLFSVGPFEGRQPMGCITDGTTITIHQPGTTEFNAEVTVDIDDVVEMLSAAIKEEIRTIMEDRIREEQP